MNIQPFFRIFPPCPALQGFINSYFMGYDTAHSIRCIPAFPQQYLIFYPYRPQQYSMDGGNSFIEPPSQMLVGPYTNAVYLNNPPSNLTIMVNFVPGALHRLTHLPLHEILNQPLNGIDGFSNEIKSVGMQLSEAQTLEQMIAIIESFLLKKIKKAKEELPIDQAFKLLIASPIKYTIDQLANLSCVGLRQFERLFLNRIGTTPTMFIRQARFKKAYILKNMQPKLSWTKIAYNCGYFDQMHLIRDFKLFSGATPKTFKDVISGESVKADHMISLETQI